jgi:5-methylcytosine-specific restriction endonuclease McrA
MFNKKEYNKEWSIRNKEFRKIYKKNYRDTHKKQISNHWKKYYQKNKQILKIRSKKYKDEHREHYKLYNKKWYIEHRKERREYNKKWELMNKEHRKRYMKLNKEKYSSNCSRRRTRLLRAEGSHTIGEWDLLKKQYGYTCPSCYKKEPKIKLTEDHIIPLSKGGSNYIDNIQPLCRSCNSSKHTTIITFQLKKED